MINAGTMETTMRHEVHIQDLILYILCVCTSERSSPSIILQKMPRLPAKQREADKVEMQLADGRYACAVADSPARHSWDVSVPTYVGYV